MSARRNRGDEELGIIGSRAKQPTDNGPLFGTSSQTKPAPRKLGPAGKRYSELPPSYDTQIGRHADDHSIEGAYERTEREPAWCCTKCGQVNPEYAPNCGRCGAEMARCEQCHGPLRPLDLLQDVQHEGKYVRLHSNCVDAWDRNHRPRARMPEDVALRGKTAPGSETSELAARAIDSQVPTLAWLVLQHIISCGANGATREEVTIALGKRLSSVTARCHELYVMGHIGSNCVERCNFHNCGHPVQTRINAETGMANEVLLYETHVARWRLDQSRPPTPLKHGRRRDG